METKIIKRNKIAVGLLIAMLLVTTAFMLGTPYIIDSWASTHEISTEIYDPQVFRYYIELDKNTAFISDNLEYFVSSLDYDAQVEMVFELFDCRLFVQRNRMTNVITANSSRIEIDYYLSTKRELTENFYKQHNLAFVKEKGFCLYSNYYTLTISHFSPHIIKTFNSIDTFKIFSDKIGSLLNTSSLYRVSIMEAVEFEDRAMRQSSSNAPRYPMSQVRQDLGMPTTENATTFTGRGINVGMIENGVPQNHIQLNEVIIHRGGVDYQTAHATNVARTFVGSLGMASGVEALHAFAAAGTGNVAFVNAMNWLLQPHRNVRIINISWGPRSFTYAWMDAFVDFHSRNNDITFVVAAGNEGGALFQNNRRSMTPALGFNVISVSSTNANGNISSYSSYGQRSGMYTRNVTVAAPGTWLETTWPANPPAGTGRTGSSGTSFAAPIVAGIIARLMEEFPILQTRPDKVKAIVIASAVPVNGQTVETFSEHAGTGRIHYDRAREATINAIGWTHISNHAGLVAASHVITPTPNSRIRIVAHWQKNSPTSANVPNNQLLTNIHTRYSIQLWRGNAGGVGNEHHPSNILIHTNTTQGNVYIIDVVQRSYGHVIDNIDRGAIAWVYESRQFQFDEIAGTNNLSVRAKSGATLPSNLVIPATFMGQTVTQIGASAFWGNSRLTSVSIPHTITHIGYSAFRHSSLSQITFTANSQLRYIGEVAFGWTQLTSIQIPVGVVRLENSTFLRSPNLTTVTFAPGSQLRYIYCWVFRETNLTTLEIPPLLTRIQCGTLDYVNPNLTIVLQAGRTSISDSLFRGTSFTNLRTIVNNNTAVQQVNNTTFGNIDRSAIRVYIPMGTYAAYRAAGWHTFILVQR